MLPAATGCHRAWYSAGAVDERGRQGGVRADDEVVAASELRRLEERVRELERLLGRKKMEVEILKEALDLARTKKPTLLSHSSLPRSTR